MNADTVTGGEPQTLFTGWDALRIVTAHLLAFPLPVIGTGILFLASKNHLLRNHCRAALNYQWTASLAMLTYLLITTFGQDIIQLNSFFLGLHFFVLVMLSVYVTFPPILITVFSIIKKKRDIVYPYTYSFLKTPR